MAVRTEHQAASLPPPSNNPRISLDIADGPTQRLYLAAAFVLVQSFKLADFIFPPELPIIVDELELNWRLFKWIVLDLGLVAFVLWLRVPRMDWGWKAVWTTRVALVALDWLVFGRWKFEASILVPTSLKLLLATYLSTTERSVRLSSVLGPEDAHLGGQWTVHVLAVSTAQINPTSTCYCLPTDSSSEPILIPLVLNNMIPSAVTYNFTFLTQPPTTRSFTVPLASLIRPSSPALKSSSDLDELEEWAIIPSSKSSSLPSSSSLHHLIPSASPGKSDSNDPFELTPSQSLFYLPIKHVGIIHLTSVLDHEGVPVRLRRKREGTEWEGVKVLRCPRAGFDVPVEGRVVHKCLNPLAPETVPMGLKVAGREPLAVTWIVENGASGKRGKAETLEGIKKGEKDEDSAELINVPLNVAHDQPGNKTYVIQSVIDGCGNKVSYESEEGEENQVEVAALAKRLLPGTSRSRTIVVHSLPEVAFAGSCGKGEDVRLLQGSKAALELKLSGVDTEVAEAKKASEGENAGEPLWKVAVKFTSESGTSRVLEMNTSETSFRFEVEQSGLYEIVGIKGKWCEGVVLVPSTCKVISQPLPTLDMSFEPLLDVCSSEVGVVSTLLLTGTPPFTVHYVLSQLSPVLRSTRKQQRITHSREQIRLEPGPGEWEYSFVKLEDAFYKDIDLSRNERFKRKQTVQLVGGAQWKNAEKGKKVHSCDGETVSVEVELKGKAPWEIEYSVVGSPTQVIRDIKTPTYKIDIEIPPQITKRGGQFSLSLQSVKDGNGCRRPLTASDLVVDVRRTKPTAKFHGAGKARSVTIKEGDRVRIPLRLTGEAPWTVKYQPPALPSSPGSLPPPVEFRTEQPNVDINVDNVGSGEYTLLSVHDRYCPGDVDEVDWTISTLPRPSLSLSPDVGAPVKNGSVLRAPVCEGVLDSINVVFEGKPPFKASYLLRKGSHQSEGLPRTLNAIQSRAELDLFTAEPGHHSYTFTGVGDSLYTVPDPAGLTPPAGGKARIVRVEQDVFPIPTATFRHGAKSGFCVKDTLASRNAGDDLIIHFEGTPPFSVDFEVTEEGHRSSQRFTIQDIERHDWPLRLPFIFDTPTSHTVSIRRVSDANHCERLVERSQAGTTVVIPVAEIASITPVLPQIDHCVGDFLEFDLQGSPPFLVTYEFNKVQHVAPVSTPKFSRLATDPGEFKILSVGHGGEQCRAAKVELVKRVHPIPSAKVRHGENIVVDIREGDQSEIVFTFEGTPPFAFTYVRRHPQDRSKDKTVLETHSVNGIMEHSYSIFTSVEGTYTVSSIADKYCAIRKAP